MQICDELYGKTHHKSNKANAFRHALWNVLICRNALSVTKNKQKSVFWAQKVGDLYEKVTQNEQLDEAMDLHNNSFGRLYFFNTLDFSEEKIIGLIKNESNQAVQIHTINESASSKNRLVYIN